MARQYNRIMARMKRVLVAAAALGAAACGGGGLGSSSVFFDRYATAFCARSMACPGSPEAGDTQCYQFIYGTVSICGMNSFMTGEEKYHSDQAQSCLDAIASQPCADLAAGKTPTACSAVYGLKPGEAPHCPIILGPLDGSTD
jgi:hypothetical protein